MGRRPVNTPNVYTPNYCNVYISPAAFEEEVTAILNSSCLESDNAHLLVFKRNFCATEHVPMDKLQGIPIRGAATGAGTGRYAVPPTLKSRGTSYVLVPPPTFTTTFILII